MLVSARVSDGCRGGACDGTTVGAYAATAGRPFRGTAAAAGIAAYAAHVYGVTLADEFEEPFDRVHDGADRSR